MCIVGLFVVKQAFHVPHRTIGFIGGAVFQVVIELVLKTKDQGFDVLAVGLGRVVYIARVFFFTRAESKYCNYAYYEYFFHYDILLVINRM